MKLRRCLRPGLAIVEFALCLPLMLLLLVGIWEVGRLVEVQQVLHNSLREGARQAATGEDNMSTITQNVLMYLQKAEPTIIATTGFTPYLVPQPTANPPYAPVMTYTKGSASGEIVFRLTFVNNTEVTRDDPTTAAQLDKYTMTLDMPFANVNWNPFSALKATDVQTMSATTSWYCMRDVPIVVNPNIPVD